MRTVRQGTMVVAVGAVLMGCGGSSSDSGGSSSAAPTPKPTAAATKAAGTAPAKSGTVAATIKDFAFKPATITVAKGAKVKWTNEDSANHTVTFKSGPKGIANLDQGQSGTVTFDKAGTYEYGCGYHPNMHGTIVVR